MDLLNVHQGTELSLLSTEQLDKLPVIDLHSVLLIEQAENVPRIIQRLSQEKLLALVDISSWNKDRFDINNFSTWLGVISSLKNYEALREFKRLDQAELSLFLTSVLDIKWYDPQEVYEGNPFLSTDRIFLLYPRDGKENSEMTMLAVQLIETAYLEGIQYGRALCIDAMNVSYSVIEEDCYRMRNSRLADEGIPTYIEALELFHFEDPTKLLKRIFKMVGKEEHKKYSPSSDYIISGFTVVPRSYWDSFKLSNEVLENIQIELSALLTSSIVVNNAIDREAEHIRGIIERSRSYLNLGLELIIENSQHNLEEMLKHVQLRHVFRLGFSLLIDLKRNAANLKSVVENANQPDLVTYDEEEFIKNLLLPIPMFQKTIDEKPVSFDKLKQLKEARKMLSDIAGRVVSK